MVTAADDSPRDPPPGSVSGGWRDTLAAGLLFAALTLVATWPLVRDLHGTTISYGPDGQLFMWTLAWDAHALVRQPLAIFDANIYYPYSNTLAYSENLIGSALLVAPLLWLGGSPALAVNVVALLSVVLCAVGAYVLARRMGLSPWAALLAGLVFGFSPARLFRTGQLHLGPVQWIPFGLVSLSAYLQHGRRRDLWLACGFFTLQSLTSGHGAAFITLAYALLLLHHAMAGRPLAIVRRVRDLGVTGVALLAPAALVYLPYRQAQAEMGLKRSLENWVVTPESYVASPSHVHQWIVARVTDAPIAETASAFLFPGWLPLALAAAALARWPGVAAIWRDRGHPLVYAAGLAAVGLWLSLGPPLGIWPLVYDWPGLSFVRVPSRFLIPAMLGLALLAGFGWERLAASGRSGRRAGLALGVGALMMVEFAAMPMPLSPVPPPPTAADRWLASLDGPVVVAEVPLEDPRRAGAFERRQTEFMLHSTAHWHRTVHGYSGLRPPLHDRLYAAMQAFPDDECLDQLAAVGVSHVVVHPALYAPGAWPAIQARIEAQRHRLELRFSAPSGRVYALR